jgi:hypothetical protein
MVSLAGGAVKASLANTSCRIDSAGNVTVTTSFAGLTVLGNSVSASPPPNTTVPLPGVGTVTLNEQTSTVGQGGTRSITVNAIHVHLAGALANGDIIVSQVSLHRKGLSSEQQSGAAGIRTIPAARARRKPRRN